ncbi:ROK family protein [Microbacterium sp. AK031]|uniref:ROK family protein n=1 Tax=Microbacterium sp. AK031 TaxID=2723076 RepID=UPI0021681F73|nr:ROK family protein [Microbacterium sp. AK031]MCS3844648.1 glucokinase [Microbacterium sp. AK031]
MIIGVDVGGTKIAVAGFVEGSAGGSAGSAGRGSARLRMVTDVRTVPTPADAGGPAVVRVVADVIAGLCDGAELTAVGIGTAGVVGADGGIFSATDAIAGWAGFPLPTAMADALAGIGADGIRVAVVNDVHAAAVAEAQIGAGAGSDSILMAAVGTGIGGAVVFADGLHRGATGTAGSLGHAEVVMPDSLAARQCPCGGHGHVEAAASGPAMEQTYLEKSGVRAGLREIDALAQRGDAMAIEVIDDGARFLGRVLASANALLDVDTIVIGGGVAEIGSRYLGAVESSYRTSALPGPSRARIVPAELAVDATLTGAAILAHALS